MVRTLTLRVCAAAIAALLVTEQARAQDDAAEQFDEELLRDPEIVEHLLESQWASVDRQIDLRAIDRQALQQSSEFHNAGAEQTQVGPEGRIVYEFGSTIPRVLCAPLHICDIELQAGEVVYDTKAGDDKTWDIVEAGTDITQHVIVKPRSPNRKTNLAIYTNRRTYFVELVSVADERDEFTPFIAFHYPEDTKARWARLRQRMAEKQSSSRADKAATEQADNGEDYVLQVKPGSLHLGYTIKKMGRLLNRRRTKWAPVRVYDDGAKTFIVMPKRLQEDPVLVVSDGGDEAVVNLRWKGRVLIVDQVFQKAVLMLGAGWYQQRVAIVREED